MFTLKLSTNRLALCLFLLLSSCTAQPTAQPSFHHGLDSIVVIHAETTITPIAATDTMAKDTPPRQRVKVETEREKKERLFRERYGNHPKTGQGAPIRFYTDSNGRKWMDVPSDTIDIEVKE